MKKNQILLYRLGKKSPSAEKKGSALRPAATLVRKRVLKFVSELQVDGKKRN